MKLVDILAQELAEWPEGVEYLTQSAVDTEIYYQVDHHPQSSVYSLRPELFASERHTEFKTYPVVNRAEWMSATKAEVKERENAVTQMLSEVNYAPWESSHYIAMAERLYDAGYRKVKP